MTMPLLDMTGIRKRFGPVVALAHVDLQVNAGEVHALIGENGAGKSTLMKILSGAYTPDAGRITFAERTVHIRGPAHARDLGIGMIYQELTLAPHLTVAENVALGMERHVAGILRPDHERIRAALVRLGYGDLDLRARVDTLGVGVQQIVEIARALLVDARLIIMDEPTSSLGAQDSEALFTVIRRLRDSGVAVIYISHFLEEVKDIADRFTVLRDGASVATGDMAETAVATLLGRLRGAGTLVGNTSR
jgi:ribose transport system ATP-binding protein